MAAGTKGEWISHKAICETMVGQWEHSKSSFKATNQLPNIDTETSSEL